MTQIDLIAMNIKANVLKMQSVAGLEDNPSTRLVCMKKLFDIAQTVTAVPEDFMELYYHVLSIMVEEQIAQIATQN